MADNSKDHREKSQEAPESVPTSDEIKNLDGLPYTVLNGIKYLCHPKLYVTSEVHALVSNLRLRDDDVWVVGYPKSGNHWAFEVVTMILNQKTEFAEKAFRYHCTEYLGTEVQKIIDSHESPRALGSHLCYPENYPKEIFEKKLKIVYLMRNPKDVFVSAYHMWIMCKEDNFYYRKSFEEFFELQIKGEFLLGSWFDHVLTFEKFMTAHPEHPVYVHSYEKMKEDPVSSIKELCVFLGKPTDLAADIARVTDFDRMRDVLNTGKMKAVNEEFVEPSNEGGIFRKGVIGDWRNMMTPEQSAQVDKVFNEKMAGSKLADLVREYL